MKNIELIFYDDESSPITLKDLLILKLFLSFFAHHHLTQINSFLVIDADAASEE